jgi:hypothetical protein
MAFRVETTETAEQNILGILDCLIEEQAGQAALRWFEGLETAIASLRKCRCVVPPRPRAKSFRLNSASFSMAGRRTSTGFCSPFGAMWFKWCLSTTVGGGIPTRRFRSPPGREYDLVNALWVSSILATPCIDYQNSL